MRSRNKKHSIKKRRQRVAEDSFRHLVVVYVSGSPYARLYDIKRDGFVLAYPTIDRALKDLHFYWSCLIAVFCVDQVGQAYMQSECVVSREKLNREQVVDVFVDQHNRLLNKANSLHVRGQGWIASPAGVDIDSQQAGVIFGQLDAWRVRSIEEEITDVCTA